MARNYRKEYDNYQGKPAQKKRRAMRNRVRRMMEREGKVKKGDGKDIHHRDGNPMNFKKSNCFHIFIHFTFNYIYMHI